MAIPLTFMLIVFFLYGLMVFILFLGIRRLKSASEEMPGNPERVTVIIPFRDEATHLPGLIGDFSRQTYPARLFKVILVNDHSSDGSGSLVSSLVKNRPGFTIMDLPLGNTGKKEALLHAMQQVDTRWVIQTDADCRVGPGFISTHMAYLAEYPSDLVAGLVTTRPEKGTFWEVLETLDMLSLTGAGAGSFHFGKPLMCSGANLLYSRSLFMETRSYDPSGITPSGDDMFLLIGARKLGRKISFNPGRLCMAETSVTTGVCAMVGQRIRWGKKSVHYRMADIQLAALLVSVTSLMVLALPVWMVIYPGSFRWLLPAYGIKTAMDFLLLLATTRLTGQRRVLRWFLPVSLVYVVYLPVVIIGSLLGHSSWKGRRFS
jgi:biofilm PGA synthesis N-glycosyltransferase PgaC